MTSACELLRLLRARGFQLRAEDGELVLTGPRPPRDEERAMAQLRAAKTDLLKVLDTEQHPAVQAAIDVFPGARVTAIRKVGAP